MKSFSLAVIVLSVVLVKIENSDVFGYELAIGALQTMQSNTHALEQTSKSVVDQRSIVDSIITVTTKIEDIVNMTIGESRCPKNKTNGAYLLKPLSSSPFQVYCKNGWIVIQRRSNEILRFNRTWIEYRNGFGDVNGDHWLGLEKMHQITRGGSYELLVVLENRYGADKTAKYTGFEIASEEEQYRLDFKAFSNGDAGDGLERQKGMKFLTPDRDENDSAKMTNSGWWFYDYIDSNLNGETFGPLWRYHRFDKNWMMIRQID